MDRDEWVMLAREEGWRNLEAALPAIERAASLAGVEPWVVCPTCRAALLDCALTYLVVVDGTLLAPDNYVVPGQRCLDCEEADDGP